jgi:hypothetical protein
LSILVVLLPLYRRREKLLVLVLIQLIPCTLLLMML